MFGRRFNDDAVLNDDTLMMIISWLMLHDDDYWLSLVGLSYQCLALHALMIIA